MSTKGGTERGSVLIIAVVGMLILGILSVSFSLLASVETKIGVNYKHQQQARVLAEGGLSFARDAVSSAASRSDGFTKWLDGTEPGMIAAHILAGPSAASGRALDPGQLWARIDNDCDTIADESGTAGSAQIVPLAIKEPDHAGPTACNNTADFNTTAVLTAWATVGSGNAVARARVRAIIGSDDPWKHVCSTATGNGTCVDPINQSGNPTINPSDPGSPHGPRSYPNLPLPQLGCSEIDATLHGNNATCTVILGRRVVTGGRTPTSGAPCDAPDGSAQYQGFFDCALTTPCQAPDYCPGPGGGGANYTRGCVKTTDNRVNPLSPLYAPLLYASVDPVTGTCPTVPVPPGEPATGMVYNFLPGVGAGGLALRPVGQNFNPQFDGQVGCAVATNPCPAANIHGRTTYVMRGTGGNGLVQVTHSGGGVTTFYGTIAMEGHGPTEDCPGNGSDFSAKSQTAIRTVAPPGGTGTSRVYGYPLVLMMYDPQQPVPTGAATRQANCADLGAGGGNTIVDGLVYSSGKVEFNPLTLNGGVVAYDVETQGSATYTYNSTYGSAAPPPGFSATAGASIALLRKSFVICTNYSVNSSATDYPAPSRCN